MNFTEGFQSFATFTLFLHHLSIKDSIMTCRGRLEKAFKDVISLFSVRSKHFSPKDTIFVSLKVAIFRSKHKLRYLPLRQFSRDCRHRILMGLDAHLSRVHVQ